MVSNNITLVATDGGCRSTLGGPRAGWGIAMATGEMIHGPVLGPSQTAQRGEVTAVFEAVQRARTCLHVITDSKYVCHTLQTALQGRSPSCVQHSDLWSRILSQLHKIVAVTWVKAHLTWDEAQPRGIQFTHWQLNQEADLQATAGCCSHGEDPGAVALYHYRSLCIRRWQHHLLRVYKLYRLLPKFGGGAPPGLQGRHRPQGPARQPRKQRTDDHWNRQHVLRYHHHTAGCSRCGRTSKAQRQGRLQQWRRPCQPLGVHLRRLAHGHKPQWQGHWRCLMCPLRGAHLAKRQCLRMHPTGGRRASFKRPPWTLFPRRPHGKEARPAPHVEPQAVDRPRRADIAFPDSPPRGPIAHDLQVTGDYEWCRLCGRTSAASHAGRLQQWRRPCVPLPSFSRKLARGHLLAFDGTWQCTVCHCPYLRLTAKRCRGPSSIPPPASTDTAPAPGNAEPPGPSVGAAAAVKRQLTLRDFFRSAPSGHRPKLGSPSRRGIG